MWDIVGKPSVPISIGKDCSGFINERPGGVAFNIAIGLSKILNKRSYELNLVSAIGKNEKTRFIRAALEEHNINTKYLLIHGDLDEVVMPTSLLEAKDFLLRNNIDVQTKMIKNCGHSIPVEASSLALNFIKKIIDK